MLHSDNHRAARVWDSWSLKEGVEQMFPTLQFCIVCVKHPLFPLHQISLPNSSTPYPCCFFAPNLPSTWNILPLLPPNTSLCLLLATYKLMPAPPFILNALAPPAFYFDLSSYRKMCVVSLCPASSGLLLGGDLCCSLPHPQVLTHGLAHNKCPCRLVR